VGYSSTPKNVPYRRSLRVELASNLFACAIFEHQANAVRGPLFHNDPRAIAAQRIADPGMDLSK
jgi:hypothetical protein